MNPVTSMKFKRFAPLFISLASPLLSAPVTPARISQLPLPERTIWTAYLARSQSNALANQVALESELTANNLTTAIRAPTGGDFKLPSQPGGRWFSSDDAAALATTVLSYQTPAGGWSKHNG
jgi:hypothetical protein